MMAEPKVFVSYASSDRSLAEQVFQKLRSMPVDVWSDDQLTVGSNWSDALRSRIRATEFFVLLLTPRTFESSWVQQELGAAWALGKRIVTIATDHRLVDKLPVDVSGMETLAVGD